MTTVAIRRLRINGLAGRAPSRAEVEAALRRALAQGVPDTTPPAAALRIDGGRTLGQATDAVAAAIAGLKGGRR
ncbi:hypothetical protein [Elioraea sp.]|uniref:hypothetical protein n=1 Tax=Elioraea sp. TaxID=2185103 RepID=UPI003F70DA66